MIFIKYLREDSKVYRDLSKATKGDFSIEIAQHSLDSYTFIIRTKNKEVSANTIKKALQASKRAAIYADHIDESKKNGKRVFYCYVRVTYAFQCLYVKPLRD